MNAGLVIVGAGGHGIDIAAIAVAAGYAVLGFLDDDDTVADRLGPSSFVLGFKSYLFGVNDSRTRERLDVTAVASPVAMHPSVSAHHSCESAPGVVVGANTTIGPAVRLGRHTHVNGNCFLTRAHLGDFVTVGPGAMICGDVTIGAGAMIGAGATISNLCTIGPRAVIGAGAVVLPRTNVPPNQTWVGVPARPVHRPADTTVDL